MAFPLCVDCRYSKWTAPLCYFVQLLGFYDTGMLFMASWYWHFPDENAIEEVTESARALTGTILVEGTEASTSGCTTSAVSLYVRVRQLFFVY